MKTVVRLGLVGVMGMLSAPLVGLAGQRADGTVSFSQPPQLANAVTTFSSANSPAAIYYFTITVPPDAGERLQRITFAQETGGETIRFNLKQSEAFEGDRSQLTTRLPLADVTTNRETRTVSVTFAPSIEPGRVVTVALRPTRNPGVKGTYLFGVTAFPAGEKVQSQFLGFGRFQFRRRGGV